MRYDILTYDSGETIGTVEWTAAEYEAASQQPQGILPLAALPSTRIIIRTSYTPADGRSRPVEQATTVYLDPIESDDDKLNSRNDFSARTDRHWARAKNQRTS